MTGQPSMPDPDRLVRRSMAIVRNMGRVDAFTAASIVHDITIELCGHHLDAGQPVPAWVEELNRSATRNLRARLSNCAGETAPPYGTDAGSNPGQPHQHGQ